MRSTSLRTFNILLLIILIAAIATSVLLFYRTIRPGISSAEKAFSEIEEKVQDFFSDDSRAPVAMETAKAELRQQLLEYTNLKSLAVYGEEGTLFYAYARNPGFLRIDGTEPIDRGSVKFSKNFFSEALFSGGAPYGEGYHSEAVFVIVSKGKIYSLALYGFIFLVIFLLLIFVLLLSSGKKDLTKSHGSTETVKTQMSRVYKENPKEAEPHEVEYSADYFASLTKESEKIYAPDSLLCFEEYLNERLDNELKRSAAFDQDLVLGMLSCKEADIREVYILLAEEVRNHFEFHDLLFEYEGRNIAVVLPNTDLEQGIAEFSDFQKHLFSNNSTCDIDAAIGLSSRNGRLIRSDRLILESAAALKKALKNRDARIIGFKPDPGKFRNYLARQSATS